VFAGVRCRASGSENMPEINGFKTIDLVAQELGVSDRKIRKAIEELKIEPTSFKIDLRLKYYSPDNIKRIKDWLLSN
jgi:transcriptional antiterminator